MILKRCCDRLGKAAQPATGHGDYRFRLGLVGEGVLADRAHHPVQVRADQVDRR